MDKKYDHDLIILWALQKPAGKKYKTCITALVSNDRRNPRTIRGLVAQKYWPSTGSLRGCHEKGVVFSGTTVYFGRAVSYQGIVFA